MNARIRIALALCLVLTLAALPPASAQQSSSLLAVADMHFNPMDDPSLVDALAEHPVEQWPGILPGLPTGATGRVGSDPGWPLLRSALDAMQQAEPHPTLILALGDFLAHRFRAHFDASARDHSDVAYRAFVAKTVAFIAQEVRRRFPDTPILAVIGNNDSDCGDYALQPGGPFLADTLPIMRGLLGSVAGPAFEADWRAGGNYVAPVSAGLRVLVVNTNFFSRRYRDACGGGPKTDPARATLDWLRQQLEAARAAGDKVWLAFHIPPGADAYATLHGGACPDAIVPMWRAGITKAFEALAHRYAGVIGASFAGHTHMDEFRLLGPVGAYDGFTLVTPAVSPIFGQNPAFQQLAYATDFHLLDRTTWYLSNLGAASADWRREYAFNAEWSVSGIDVGTLSEIDQRIASNADARAQWMTIFSVNAPGMWRSQAGGDVPSAATLRAHLCAQRAVDPDAFRECYCADAPR